MMAGYKEGIDVSTYQGEMDWDKAVEAGAEFAIFRAGSITDATGELYTDYQFERNRRETERVLRGRRATYWFFRPKWDPIKQADYYAALIKNMEPMTIVNGLQYKVRWACDEELPGAADVVKTFCRRMEIHFPDEDGLLYTNPNTWLFNLTGDKGWGDDYLLWLADWTPPAWIMPPWVEEGHAIWQYAVRRDGALYGAKSIGLDHDRGYFEWPEEALPPVETGTQLEILSDNFNIRSEPVILPETDIGNLHKGKRVKALDDVAQGDWWRVEAWIHKSGVKKL